MECITKNHIVIYQIGRLESRMFSKLPFVIEGRTFTSDLSSVAIKEHFLSKGQTAEIILLYPVSLPFQPFLLQNENFKSQCEQDCFEALKRVNEQPDNYLNSPNDFFYCHPHTKYASDFLVIPSFGTYKTLKRNISLEARYSDILLSIVFHLIRRFIDGFVAEQYIIDISSGHNIYVSALIEAMRFYCVWLGLYLWETDRPQMNIAISEPIIPGVDTSYRVYFERLQAKALFSSPLTGEDIKDFNLSRTIYPSKDRRDKKRRLQETLESFVTVFSAIKNNIPLFVYQKGYHGEERIKEILRELITAGENALKNSYRTSSGLDKDVFLKSLLALGFYAGIIRILKESGVVRCSPEGVALNNLRKGFKKVYKAFNLMLNDTVLGNEIDRLERDLSPPPQWSPLGGCLREGDPRVTPPQKRNFFAHAGLERNVTECRKAEGTIFVRYREGDFQTIENWLVEGLDE